jgi:hypothetical protein
MTEEDDKDTAKPLAGSSEHERRHRGGEAAEINSGDLSSSQGW